MALFRYLCQVYKQLLPSRLETSSMNVNIWAKKIHSSAKRLEVTYEYEVKEQTMHNHEVQKLHLSADNEDCRRPHIPVMVKEVVNFLSPQPGQHMLDMTFGAGGHTAALLQKVTDITIYALDRDPAAYKIAQQLSESYPYPDMPTAADVVNALDQQALASILRTYGEERHAKKIASALVQARSIYPITRTQQLASIVAGAFPAGALYARKDLLQRPTHVATKTFQALRIYVNDELHELYVGLKIAEKFLKPGGRLVALSFHSLEDRIIKRFLQGRDVSEKSNLNIRQKIREGQKKYSEQDVEEFSSEKSNSRWTSIQKKVLTPQAADIQENPRGRSAKLRAAIKL
nr:probable methyltransferase-like protein 15 isoform X2 [Pelodiscus sinensis]|eukprot:XP_025040851.1 probable methyltransferase-like protein 15 isoform X2 [Pelodiscus sinensis]